MISRTFLKSSFIYTIVGSLPYAAGFLLLPWLTRYLTPEQFGINALYISLMYLIQIIASFGLDMAIGAIYFDYKDNRDHMRQFLGTLFIGMLVIGTFTFIFFACGGFRLFTWIFRSGNYLELIPFGMITLVSAIFNSVFKTYSTLLIYQQRPERFFWINISNFLITITATLLILHLFPFTLNGPIIGRLIPAIISASVAAISLSREFGLAWNSEYVKKIFRVSSPLLIYAVLTWVVNYIDRFIIMGILKDPTVVGIYDISIKLVLFIDLIMAGLINTVNPKVFSIWSRDGIRHSTPEVNRYYSGLTAFFMILIPVFVLVAPVIIPYLISNKIYFSAFQYLAILAAGYVTRVWFFMFLGPIMFFKKTTALPRVLLFSSAFEIGAGVLLIKLFGIQGMVWTFFLVKPVQAFFLWLESRKVFDFQVNNLKIFYLPVLFMVVVIGSEWMAKGSWRLPVHGLQLLASCVLVWFAYRKEIIPLLRKKPVQ
jgi:O-antigen/teichoic acid export membrane protein